MHNISLSFLANFLNLIKEAINIRRNIFMKGFGIKAYSGSMFLNSLEHLVKVT
jgi:hypothetical protein